MLADVLLAERDAIPKGTRFHSLGITCVLPLPFFQATETAKAQPTKHIDPESNHSATNIIITRNNRNNAINSRSRTARLRSGSGLPNCCSNYMLEPAMCCKPRTPAPNAPPDGATGGCTKSSKDKLSVFCFAAMSSLRPTRGTAAEGTTGGETKGQFSEAPCQAILPSPSDIAVSRKEFFLFVFFVISNAAVVDVLAVSEGGTRYNVRNHKYYYPDFEEAWPVRRCGRTRLLNLQLMIGGQNAGGRHDMRA